MAFAPHRHPAFPSLRNGCTLAALTASLLLGACGQVLSPGSSDLLSLKGSSTPANAPSASAPPPSGQAVAQTGGVSDDLLKATDYWGKAYAENPRDLNVALSYARNLKAMNEKRRALAVLQQASIFHGQSRELAGEYGRLALDLDQISVAKQLLAIADDPAKPDWRIISARGAALAKEGNYNEAIPFFEHALSLSHDQPSLLSNLALAHAMNGEPGKAESMLRQAAAADSNSPRIRQNLALVLGLQGKYDEAKLVAARDIPMGNASENADYLRQVVKLDPKSVPDSTPLPAEWSAEAKVAEAPTVAAVPVQKVADMKTLPPIDTEAAQDTAWVVTSDKPALAPPTKGAAASGSKVMSVAEMAAQIAGGEDGATAAKPKRAAAPTAKTVQKAAADNSNAWTPMVAQAQR
jgi:Flp pilus assembly protein TadD